MPPYSVDLDFSIENCTRYDIEKLAGKLKSGLRKAGYQFSLIPRIERTVQTIEIKFEGLLQEALLIKKVKQTLTIKIEIDSDPPTGAALDSTILLENPEDENLLTLETLLKLLG